MDHIESRPSKSSANHYDFFVLTKEEPTKIKSVVTKLKEDLKSEVTVLDSNPDTSNPMWFPRRIQDLVCVREGCSQAIKKGTEGGQRLLLDPESEQATPLPPKNNKWIEKCLLHAAEGYAVPTHYFFPHLIRHIQCHGMPLSFKGHVCRPRA